MEIMSETVKLCEINKIVKSMIRTFLEIATRPAKQNKMLVNELSLFLFSNSR